MSWPLLSGRPRVRGAHNLSEQALCVTSMSLEFSTEVLLHFDVFTVAIHTLLVNILQCSLELQREITYDSEQSLKLKILTFSDGIIHASVVHAAGVRFSIRSKPQNAVLRLDPWYTGGHWSVALNAVTFRDFRLL